MKQNRVLAALVCGVAVVFAALVSGSPAGVAKSEQEPADQWEVASPSDATLPALRSRITRIEQRVAALESERDNKPEPVRSSVPVSESWQTSELLEVVPKTGQRTVANTITSSTTETVCTGGVCRLQTQNNAGPLRRLFRR